MRGEERTISIDSQSANRYGCTPQSLREYARPDDGIGHPLMRVPSDGKGNSQKTKYVKFIPRSSLSLSASFHRCPNPSSAPTGCCRKGPGRTNPLLAPARARVCVPRYPTPRPKLRFTTLATNGNEETASRAN